MNRRIVQYIWQRSKFYTNILIINVEAKWPFEHRDVNGRQC